MDALDEVYASWMRDDIEQLKEAMRNAERVSLDAIGEFVPQGDIAAEALLADTPTRTDGFYRRWSAAEGVKAKPALGSCCDDPRPRILHRTGRVFCGSCKRYLDNPLKEDDHDDNGRDDDQARDTGQRNESGNGPNA
jgi:hypothetical protein